MALVLVSIVMIVIGELGVRIAAPQPASWLDVYRRHPTLPFYTLGLTSSASSTPARRAGPCSPTSTVIA